MTSPVARSATATPVPGPPRPCDASAFEMPRASAASCTPFCARRERDRHEDGQGGERDEECPQSSLHHRNVMVMVWLPYTAACALGIQMSIVAPDHRAARVGGHAAPVARHVEARSQRDDARIGGADALADGQAAGRVPRERIGGRGDRQRRAGGERRRRRSAGAAGAVVAGGCAGAVETLPPPCGCGRTILAARTTSRCAVAASAFRACTCACRSCASSARWAWSARWSSAVRASHAACSLSAPASAARSECDWPRSAARQ